MADENIGSKLGFDAAAAIASINKLKRELDGYNSSLAKVASTTGGFNTEQKAAGDTLGRMVVQLQLAAGALRQYATAQNQAAAATNSSNAAQAKNLIAQKPTNFQQNLGINPNAPPAQGFGQTLGEAAQQRNAQQLRATELALRNVARQATDTGQAVAAGANQGAAAANNLALSWRTVIRVFGIQFAARAVASVVSSLLEGVQAAKDFEIQLAEIQTISKQFEESGLAGVSAVVTNLSNQFGRPVEEVAKGLYQTLSNQIGNATESTRFLADAMEFGGATLATTADSVDLLSGVLNAYGLTAASTTRISDELFKTVELGRVTGSELANTYGRLTTLSAQLGVSTAEVNAALAVLTINGVKASDAMTQISNVFLKLVQPSENTKKAFQDIGVASAEAGIAAFGLQGFLEKLANGKTALSDIADLLGGRIRAIRGASTLVSQTEQLNQDLTAIKESAGATARAFALINGTNAQELNRQIQIARNTTVEFGRSAIAVFVNVVNAVGGAKVAFLALTAVIGTLVGIGIVVFLGNVTSALVSLVTGVNAATASVVLLRAALVGVAAGAVIFVAKFLTVGDIVQNTAAKIQQLQKQADIEIKIKVADALPDLQKQQAAISGAGSQIEKTLIAQGNLIQRLREANIRANSDITSDLEHNLKSRTDLVGQGVKALENLINSTADRTKSLSQEINQLVQDSFKNQFESQVSGLSPVRQVQARLNAVRDLASKATALSLSGNPDDQKQAIDFLKQAFDQANKIANVSGFQRFGLRAENDLRNQAVQIEKNIADANAKTAASAQATLDRENKLAGQAKENASAQTAVAVAVKNLNRDIENATNNTIVFEKQFAVAAAGVNVSVDSIRQGLQQLRTGLVAGSISPISTTALSDSKAAVAQADLVIAQFEGIAKRAKDALVSGEKQAIIDSQKEIAVFVQAFANSGNDGVISGLVKSLLGDPNAIISSGFADLSAKLDAAAAALIDKRKAALQKADTEVKANALLQQGADNTPAALNNIPQLLNTLGTAGEEASKGLTSLGTAAGTVPPALDGVQTSVNSFNTDNLVTQSNRGIEALQRLAQAQAGVGGLGRAPAAAAFGRYFANGGFAPRGTDTIPAMLSPGEFVINAASSRRFFSQLTAINSGINPVFRAEGGSVTNVNVGDININGSRSNPDQVANAVVDKIRRLRRRNAKNINR